MSLIDEIKSVLGLNENTATSYRITVFGEKAGYFENVKSIKYYDEKEIALYVCRGEIIVKGENLFVKKYCAGDVAICGKITAIERK